MSSQSVIAREETDSVYHHRKLPLVELTPGRAEDRETKLALPVNGAIFGCGASPMLNQTKSDINCNALSRNSFTV